MEPFNIRIPLIKALGFREDGIDSLRLYVELLWKANEELNLISRQMTFEELIDNHIIDSLLPLNKFPKNLKSVADFGSGGGIPGVVYAIHFNQTQFTLFEKSVKKQEFLKRCQNITANLTIRGDIPLQLDGFELVTARAFKPLDVILDMSRNYYKKGGSYFLLKGRKEKINEEVAISIKKFKDLEVQIDSLHSPILEVERHLVRIGP